MRLPCIIQHSADMQIYISSYNHYVYTKGTKKEACKQTSFYYSNLINYSMV